MEPSLCISSGRKGRCQFLHYYVLYLEYETTSTRPWNMKLLKNGGGNVQWKVYTQLDIKCTVYIAQSVY